MECRDLPRKLIMFTVGLPRVLGHIPSDLSEEDDIADGEAEGHGAHLDAAPLKAALCVTHVEMLTAGKLQLNRKRTERSRRTKLGFPHWTAGRHDSSLHSAIPLTRLPSVKIHPKPWGQS